MVRLCPVKRRTEPQKSTEREHRACRHNGHAGETHRLLLAETACARHRAVLRRRLAALRDVGGALAESTAVH